MNSHRGVRIIRQNAGDGDGRHEPMAAGRFGFVSPVGRQHPAFSYDRDQPARQSAARVLRK